MAIPAVGASLAEETKCEKPWGENELVVFQGGKNGARQWGDGGRVVTLTRGDR